MPVALCIETIWLAESLLLVPEHVLLLFVGARRLVPCASHCGDLVHFEVLLLLCVIIHGWVIL